MGAFGPHGGPITRTAVSLFSPSERADLHEIKTINDIEGHILYGEFSSPDQHQIKLASELNDLQLLESSDGQIFSALWLNRSPREHDKELPLLLAGNGFLASVTQLDGKYRAYHLAREFPDHQIIVYDQPGHGESSRFTKKQRKELTQGSMQDVGQNQFSAIQNFTIENLAPVSSVVARAESFGSRGLLDVVAASRDGQFPIDAAVLLELPGAEGGRRFDIHSSYFGYEWLKSSYYGAKINWWTRHKEEFKAFLETYSDQPMAEPSKSFFVRDPLMAVGNFYDSVLGQGNGLGVLEEIVQDNVQVVRSTAERGRIDKLSAAEAQRRAMLEKHGKTWGQIVLLHESHDGSGFAPRARLAAKLVHFALEYAPDIAALQESYPVTMRRIQQGVVLAPNEITV